MHKASKSSEPVNSLVINFHDIKVSSTSSDLNKKPFVDCKNQLQRLRIEEIKEEKEEKTSIVRSECYVQKQCGIKDSMHHHYHYHYHNHHHYHSNYHHQHQHYNNSLSTFIFIMLLIWSLTPNLATARQNTHQTCPGCPHQQQHAHLHRTGNTVKDAGLNPDVLRLEAIKVQILHKLGLTRPPNVNKTLATVPKRLALETIYRAEAQQTTKGPTIERTHQHNSNSNDNFDEFGYPIEDEYSYRNLDRNVDNEPELNENVLRFQDYDDDMYRSPEPEVVDDFYARTSEIITFAEPGKSFFI